LLKQVLHKLNDHLKDVETNRMSDKILCITDVLENLMPFLLMSVVTQEDILLNIEKDMAIKMSRYFNYNSNIKEYIHCSFINFNVLIN
jgi:hypothetical protein